MGVGVDYDELPAALETSVCEFNNRPLKEFVFTILYLVALALTVLIGLSGIGTSNPSAFFAYLHDTKGSCPLPSSGHPQQPSSLINLFQLAVGFADDTPAASDPVPPAIHATIAFIISLGLVGSVGLGLLYFIMCKKQANLLLKITTFVFFALLTGLHAFIGISGDSDSPGPLTRCLLSALILVGLAAMLFLRRNWSLVAGLMSLAGHCVTENRGVFKVTLFMEVVVAGAVEIVFYALMFVAVTNGSVSYNPNRLALHDDTQAPGNQVWGQAVRTQACYDMSDYQVACCSWTPVQWSLPYLCFTVAVLLSTMYLICKIKVFAVASTISRWYFGTDPPPSPALQMINWDTIWAAVSGQTFLPTCRGAITVPKPNPKDTAVVCHAMPPNSRSTSHRFNTRLGRQCRELEMTSPPSGNGQLTSPIPCRQLWNPDTSVKLFFGNTVLIKRCYSD